MSIFISITFFGQPKLAIKEAKINFGFINRGEIVKNIYEISNAGNQPLLINELEISCSCTTAEFSKQPIMPGQTSTITILFNTKTVYGRQDRVVYIHSNDPKGLQKLRYKGVVSNE